MALGLALELAAGTILAEVLAVLVALADGDGVAFAVELALAEGLALADALGEAEVAGVLVWRCRAGRAASAGSSAGRSR